MPLKDLLAVLPRLLLPPTLLALAACSTIYVPPPGSSPTAKLRIGQTEEAFQTLPFVLPDKCLTDDSFPHGEQYITLFGTVKSPDKRLRVSLGMPDPPSNRENFHETRIPAGREFNFEFFRIKHTEYNLATQRFTICKVAFSFVPEAAVDYETIISNGPAGCRASLDRLVSRGTSVQRVPVAPTRIDASTCSARH